VLAGAKKDANAKIAHAGQIALAGAKNSYKKARISGLFLI